MSKVYRYYNYEYIYEFCQRYKCKLLTTKENFINDEKIFSVELSCGHTTNITFCKFFNKRSYFYCEECFEKYKNDGINCFCCNIIFKPTYMTQVYCSENCVKNAKSQVQRNAMAKYYDYYDDDGNLSFIMIQ